MTSSETSDEECLEAVDPYSPILSHPYKLTPSKLPSIEGVSKKGKLNCSSEGNFKTTEHEIINIDPVPPQEISVPESAQRQRNVGNSTSVLYGIRGNNGTRLSSFKKQAILSKILQDDEYSSSDEELYSVGSIHQRSVTYPNPPCDAYQSASPESKNSWPTGAVVCDGKISEESPQYCEIEEEVIPLQLPPTAVKSNVLNEVKSPLNVVQERRRSDNKAPIQSDITAANVWEMRKKQQNESILRNKTKSSKIKAGLKVRQCLANLPERGMLCEVDAIFSLVKVTRDEAGVGLLWFALSGFDKNYLDENGKSALTIAIDSKDESMMRNLMEHGVDLDLSIFHAIRVDFMEGLKLILAYRTCTDVKVEEENPYFRIGITPMLFAAHNNNYHMLSLLHRYGHRLPELKDRKGGINDAWESSNERRMICLAMAQPAYITLITDVDRINPMKYCLKRIKQLRTYIHEEHEFSSFYEDVIVKFEEYMCSVLDFICSSDELADLFQFDRPPVERNKNHRISTSIDDAKTRRSNLLDSFQLLEKASRENLVKFVTHQQSQLALSHIRYRSLPMMRNYFIAYGISIFFPFLSIFYIFAPNSDWGGIITLPIVSFHCHVMSDIIFAVLLLLRIAVGKSDINKLGETFTPLEGLILLWIIGKWVHEFEECFNRRLKAYLRDYWNYADLTLLSLFSAGIFISHCPRISLETRLIGEGFQAWGYVLVFLRLLGLMTVDRYLGPLQISLGKMLADIVRFLFIFALVLGAFAFGLNDLYRYYGTSEETDTTQNCSTTKAFTSIPGAMADLFWALFGLFDLGTMSLNEKYIYTEYIGKSLVATYHVVAIIVMLNMLIAMMSKSYEDTSENEETAWKFHRTSVWIRFIRREAVLPPPMNLIPNPWKIKECFAKWDNKNRRVLSEDENTNFRENESKKILEKLVCRYKTKNLIERKT